jgi:hypothetical protein
MSEFSKKELENIIEELKTKQIRYRADLPLMMTSKNYKKYIKKRYPTLKVWLTDKNKLVGGKNESKRNV